MVSMRLNEGQQVVVKFGEGKHERLRVGFVVQQTRRKALIQFYKSGVEEWVYKNPQPFFGNDSPAYIIER